MKNIALIIFARLNSKRLNKKVFSKICNKLLLEIVYLRLKKNLNFPIIVNTSIKQSDNEIVKFCTKNKIKVYRGNLNNVFLRTVKCLKKYKIDSFVRINADRPFIDFNQIKKAIEIFKKNKYDIVTNQLKKKSPKGLSCEVAKSKIFFEVLNKEKLNKSEKEHIFNFFYKKKNDYKIYELRNKMYEKNLNLNLSIDKKTDLYRAIKIFEKFNKNIYVSTKKVLKTFHSK